jgi:hypothetical protein
MRRTDIKADTWNGQINSEVFICTYRAKLLFCLVDIERFKRVQNCTSSMKCKNVHNLTRLVVGPIKEDLHYVIYYNFTSSIEVQPIVTHFHRFHHILIVES